MRTLFVNMVNCNPDNISYIDIKEDTNVSCTTLDVFSQYAFIVIMLCLFDTLVKPVITYGGEVWGVSRKSLDSADKLYLQYVRNILNIKHSTSKLITYGECGKVPISNSIKQSLLCFLNRIHHKPSDFLVKKVYLELVKLHELGFNTWVTSGYKLFNDCGLNFDSNLDSFKKKCKKILNDRFINDWITELRNVEKNPIIRTYCKIKNSFIMEPYLYKVKNVKYRNAINKLRSSSHHLEIERGQHCKPSRPLEDYVVDVR